MDPEKQSPKSMPQNVSGNDNIVVGGNVKGKDIVVGNNNNINQTFIQRIMNVFQWDTEAQRAMRNRRTMLKLVKNTWIKGVLEKSLYAEILIELGMEERPGAVDHPWDIQIQMPNQVNRALPAGTSVMDVFDEMSSAMLILGEPGSGKTTMLLELARDCIDRAYRDDNQPIPVILNLSSWDSKQSIDDWVTNELNTKYNVPKKTAKNWVTNDDLSLLLDGLDEVKLEYREASVKAINDFRQKHGLATPIAICSRIADYEALSAKLYLQGALFLQPLTPKQVDEYFEKAGPELEEAHRIVKNDIILQELVKQPLILSIMTLAYQGKSIDTLASDKKDTLETHRKHLFDAYIKQMFKRVARANQKIYSQKRTLEWLAWLAKEMLKNRQSIFLLEKMNNKWLQTHVHQNLHKTILRSVTVLIITITVVLFFGIRELFTVRILYGWDVIYWAICGLTFALTIVSFFIRNEEFVERTAELIKWSWRKASLGFVNGLTVGLFILGPIIGLLTGLIYGLIPGLKVWPITGILSGLAYGIYFGVIKADLEIKRTPNQGVQQSLHNAIIVGLISTLFIGSSLELFTGDSNGLILGLLIGQVVGLSLGGYAVLSHYILRFILYINRHIPFKYVHFLDYCTDLIFLRRVGGGYIFVHRLIMEHFAAMYTENK